MTHLASAWAAWPLRSPGVDGLTFLTSAAVTLVMTMAGSLLRAVRVDPLRVMRAE